ncbi:hypothetical protein Hanom_Chr08g00751891 [Helianthus anomalus]
MKIHNELSSILIAYNKLLKSFICSTSSRMTIDKLPSFMGLGNTKHTPSKKIRKGPMKTGGPHPKSAS